MTNDRDQELFTEDQRSSSVPLASPDELDMRRQLQLLSPDERIQGILNIAQLKEQLDAGARIEYVPSRPCRFCNSIQALVYKSGTQLPVKCTNCGRVSYNAPRSEVGLVPRSVRTVRDDISPSQQARIFDRDHGRCVFCGTHDDLVIGHLLSVAEGERVGATREELNDDSNLAAMCEACNAGLNDRSVSPLTYMIILHLIRASRSRPVVELEPAGGG